MSTSIDPEHLRLRRLARIVERELAHLQLTDARVFTTPFDSKRARELDTDVALAERVDAFVARFGRLQDTLGDKLLPALLRMLGEAVGAALDNLDRAERLGWISSSDNWMAMRRLRNRMVHEYVDDPAELADALQSAHAFVGDLADACRMLLGELQHRGWA